MINSTTGFERLVVTQSSAIPLTSSVYGNSCMAIMTVEGGRVRTRTDGGLPTTSLGLCHEDGACITLESVDEIVGFRVIATSSNATINVEYKG